MPMTGVEMMQPGAGTDPSQRLTDQMAETDQFMNLLLEQLKHQDPMDPMNNDQFISQMAELTTVERLGAISKSIESLARENSTNQYLGLLGANVSIDSVDSEQPVTGIVDSVRFTEDGAQVVIDGKRINSSDILEISLADFQGGS